MIVVYAPQDNREKKSLWEYLQLEISRWKGEVIVMGGFNEVRVKSDRFGSTFYERGAFLFNSFISDSGLAEVPLGGSHFTWCLKSAKKMSKLDRFLVSKSLLASSPHITALTLDRYLSDHRPILLRENVFDYSPTPFRFYQYWTEVEGFDDFVMNCWKNSPVMGQNALKIFMSKMKCLKRNIREWHKHNSVRRKNMIHRHKKDLEVVDKIIDDGIGTEDDIREQSEILLKLLKCDELASLEMAKF